MASGSVSPVERRLETQKLNRLPAMPVIAQELLGVIASGEMDVQRMAVIIDRDPALLARLVGLANSAYFSYPGKVVTAEDAIIKVVGINVARSLAFSIVLAGPFDTSRCEGFRVEKYWTNAIGTAVLARNLVPLLGRAAPSLQANDAYLAGLLHNFGLLVLVHLYPEEMRLVFRRYAERGTELPLTEIERQQLGTEHQQVGGWLARKWHLPPGIVATIEHHLDPSYAGGHHQLVQLIGFSARWLDGLLGDRPFKQYDFFLDRGVSLEELDKVLNDAREQLDGIFLMARYLAGESGQDG